MLEGQPKNDLEKYEDFRKEIEGFKDLPDSSFVDKYKLGEKLEVEEAKKLHAHAIMERINNAGLPQDKLIELTHLWEKEILGLKNERTMYDGAGNVI